MKPHFLLTKLQRPPVAPDILPRTRLLDQLNEGRQRTLTLISAPAGCGKSTLASLWAASCDCPYGWVSLDRSDSDLRTFLSYFLAAIQTLFPDIEMRTEALLETSRMLAASDLSRQLLNDLHQISEPFILVLDDYHCIRAESPVHDLLTEYLAHPPRSRHLVLVARRDPPLSISRLRGHDQMTEIRASDLRFTPAETRSKYLSDPDAKKESRLSEKTPGPILTQREIELLPLLAEGLSNKEIAARLFIAPVTVKTHLQNIYRKLKAKGRIESLNKARELGIITSD